MDFEQMLRHRTLYTIEEFDVVTGCKHGSFEINKEQCEFYEDIPKNKWLNQEDLGDWAWDELKQHNLVHIPKEELYLKVVSISFRNHLSWKIALACLGKEEIERRLQKQKRVRK